MKFYVSSDDVAKLDEQFPNGLRTIPGTMSFHQIVSTAAREISCRKLSCFARQGNAANAMGQSEVLCSVKTKFSLREVFNNF